jgi:type IV pilus assembly protein PilQ
MVLTLVSFGSATAATLKDMSYATLPGNRLEVKLQFDGTPPEVKGYSIEKPARIALDLMGATSGLSSKYHNLGTGNARNITVVEAKDRTRLIVNLVQLQGYSTEVDGNTLLLVLGGEPKSAEQQVSTTSAVREKALNVVDFKRGAQGEGQVVIRLSDPSTPVDVREEGGRVVARFVGASLPKELHRRLDVTDFATPVRFVDAKSDGSDAIISIESSPSVPWEYLAYQADNQFTINVKPVSQSEAAKRKKDAFQYSGEKLSLSFQDIDVRSVLQLIADFTGLNLVASDTVEGSITLRLQNVPWDQALDLILKTKGLDKRQLGNVLLVAPADEIAAREQLELESQRKVEALAPLRSEYIRINYAKADDMAQLIRKEGSLLSSRGTITTDERTNTLILQDTDRKLEEIKEVITILDVPVRQVLIEARVVIASTNVAKEVGVRWGGFQLDADGVAKSGKGLIASGRASNVRNIGIDSVFNGDDIEIISPDDFVVDMGVRSADATRFSLGFVDINSGLLELELSALDSEGRAELVATPKVLTADQQPALIASGQQIGYETATASGATQIAFIEAELRLEVTPQITPEGKVLMEIKVNNDSLNADSSPRQPLLDTNRLESSVLVGDGETVVLGGIFQQVTNHSVVKTPLLGDLPWIGNLFRRKVDNDTRQELLIFITPKVVKDIYASN